MYKLFLLQRKSVSYCETSACVIAAENEPEARQIAQAEEYAYREWMRGEWTERATCEFIGDAAQNIKKGVILKQYTDC